MATKMTAKPARTLRFADGVLRITQDGKATHYAVTLWHGEYGLLGVRLAKRGGDEAVYDVDVQEDRCDCLGHLRHGRCKHMAAVAKLIELGRI